MGRLKPISDNIDETFPSCLFQFFVTQFRLGLEIFDNLTYLYLLFLSVKQK